MGLGEFYSLLCALLWASAVVLYKYLGNSLSANNLNLAKNIIGFSLLLPTAMIVEGFVLPTLSLTNWLVLIASGYFGIAVADTWYLQALRYLGAGRTAIVASLYSPFVVILSIFFLGEYLQAWQWFGFVLVLVGILVVVYQRHYQDVDQSNLLRGVSLAACSVFLTAAGVVAMKPILTNDGFFWIATLRLCAGIVGMLIYIVIRGKTRDTISSIADRSHPWSLIALASALGTYLAMLFWLAGFKYANASVASVLNETANVFIVLMALLFLKEEFTKRKLVGVLMTFVGVIVFLGVFGD